MLGLAFLIQLEQSLQAGAVETGDGRAVHHEVKMTLLGALRGPAHKHVHLVPEEVLLGS